MREKTGKPGLVDKKNLLVHNYDLFLEKQVRLFCAAAPNIGYISSEISAKFDTLILDDLIIFAISCRRLIELCGLRSASNSFKIAPLRFDPTMKDYCFERMQKEAIGFATLCNNIIHMANFTYINDWRLIRKIARSEKMHELLNFDQNAGKMPLCFLLSDEKKNSAYYALKDIVETSVEIAEKIVETCANAGVYLELEYRVM